MFTASKIKLIYCYLICLFLTIFLVFNITSMAQNYLKLKNFEEAYQLPYNLTKAEFYQSKNKEKMTLPQIEQLRLDLIEENKKEQAQLLHSKIILDLPYLVFPLLILIGHIILIRSTRDS